MNIPLQKEQGHKLDPTILRAYDIRGIVGETLNAEDALNIGKAFGTYVLEKSSNSHNMKIAVGYDGRLTSPELEEAIVEGIKSTGAEVVQIGLGPTPMLYFAVRKLELDGGVMITGSHNPPDHNGFKFMLSKQALYGEEIQQLGNISETGGFVSAEGSTSKKDIFEEYLGALLSGYKNSDGKSLSIAWDAGNGATGDVMRELANAAPSPQILLNENIDGTFPSHHPDPSDPKNLEQLIDAIEENNCDFGIAFDGDGDRIGVVDGKGRAIAGDQLMMLYAKEVLKNNPGATIIADVKASQSLFNEIEKLGGKSLMWKTGHSFIKAKMAETGALFAGEMSGHMFFADEYYGFDDGLYAAVRLIDLVAGSEKTLTEMVDELPQACNTPEIRIDVPEERKFKVIEEVKERLVESGANFNDIDGVRVMTSDGWWLLRASNTQAALVARCEAKDEESLELTKKDLEDSLASSRVFLK